MIHTHLPKLRTLDAVKNQLLLGAFQFLLHLTICYLRDNLILIKKSERCALIFYSFFIKSSIRKFFKSSKNVIKITSIFLKKTLEIPFSQMVVGLLGNQD